MINLFGKTRTQEIKSHLNNLVTLAYTDGKFSHAEKKLIFEVGRRRGLSQEQIKEVIKNEKNIPFQMPDSEDKKLNQVCELAEMLIASGRTTEEEIDTCIEMVERLGFRKAIVGVMVRRLITGLEEGKNTDELKEECKSFM